MLEGEKLHNADHLD